MEQAIQALEGPGLPEEAAYLWGWFLELNEARGSNGFGPASVGFAEIEAWARLTRRRPLPWEVRWLRLLDRTWLADPEKRKPTQ